mgnify:FL=1
MTELTALTITEARSRLKRKEFTSLELTEAHLSAIERARDLNAYITETFELARERAKAADAKLQAGRGGALEGIPLGIKDLFCTEGVQKIGRAHV